MKNLMIVILTTLMSMSASAGMDKAECKTYKKENKRIVVNMTEDQAFCIDPRAKLTSEYIGTSAKYEGKIVRGYMSKPFAGLIGGYTVFVIIDGVVVKSVKS